MSERKAFKNLFTYEEVLVLEEDWFEPNLDYSIYLNGKQMVSRITPKEFLKDYHALLYYNHDNNRLGVWVMEAGLEFIPISRIPDVKTISVKTGVVNTVFNNKFFKELDCYRIIFTKRDGTKDYELGFLMSDESELKCGNSSDQGLWFRVTEAPETGLVFEELFVSAEQLISGEVEILQGISRIPQELKKDESQKDYDPYAQTWHNVYQEY